MAPPIEGLLLRTALGDIEPYLRGMVGGFFVTLSIYYSLGERVAVGMTSPQSLLLA